MPQRTLFGVMLVFSVVALPGCDLVQSRAVTALQEEAKARSAKIDQLEAQATLWEVQIESLSSRLLDAEFRLIGLESKQYETATFDPAGEGFGRIDTTVGSFAVSIQEVKPQADGVRVVLHVGNLSSATVRGATFKVKWGPRPPKFEAGSPEKYKEYQTAREEWKKKLQEKKINTTKQLRSGTWNTVPLSLPGTRPDQFGHLEVAIDSDQIALLTEK